MSDREPNEVMLVCAARRGDKEALQTLLSCNWSWLKGLVYSVLGDGRDLDDVMQEVCLRAIADSHAPRAGEVSGLAGHPGPARGDQALPPPKARAVAPDEPGYASDPAEDVARKELCGRVLEAVRELPQKYREVFMLAHSGGLTYAQMAEVLDVPITTLQIRLVRARQMIRDRITREIEQLSRGNDELRRAEGA